MAAVVPVISTISTILGVAGTVGQLYSGVAASKRQVEMNKYNEQVARRNAEIARKDALRKENELRREGAFQLGRQRALLAEGGVLESASGKAVLEQSYNQFEYDALNLRYQGEVKAMGLLTEAEKHKSAASYAQDKGALNLGLGLIKQLT